MEEKLQEITFHCVGEGGPGGDAISLTYLSTEGGFLIDIIDGGTLDSGKQLVEWIKKSYGDNVRVRSIVCTHGDQNHISGARPMLEAFDVEAVYVNFPWKYTSGQTSKELKEHFSTLAELESLVKADKIRDALQGTQVGLFKILAPSSKRYAELAPSLHESPNLLRRFISGATESALEMVPDRWDTEKLEEFLASPTSLSNESSVVQFAEFDSFRILLTGDAGVNALGEAVDYAENQGLVLPIQSSLENPFIIQVPHHGSRHNISTEVLDRWLGQRVCLEDHKHQYALACVGKDSETHPRRKTTNAFNRRGCVVVSNKDGFPIVHPISGSRQAHVHPFYSNVEA